MFRGLLLLEMELSLCRGAVLLTHTRLLLATTVYYVEHGRNGTHRVTTWIVDPAVGSDCTMKKSTTVSRLQLCLFILLLQSSPEIQNSCVVRCVATARRPSRHRRWQTVAAEEQPRISFRCTPHEGDPCVIFTCRKLQDALLPPRQGDHTPFPPTKAAAAAAAFRAANLRPTWTRPVSPAVEHGSHLHSFRAQLQPRGMISSSRHRCCCC